MEFTISEEGKSDSEMTVYIPNIRWERWKQYSFSQKMEKNRLYGWDFAENEELRLISIHHISDIYKFELGLDPAKEFYQSIK